jgi:hypothetical protein
MADVKLPYIAAYNTITKGLEKIQAAATPDRFTQDFLANTLGMPGGTPKPLIPYLKRTGFLNTDGSPTELYRRFRNAELRGAAAAAALRVGYEPLYQIHETVHELGDSALRGVIVQATGLEKNSNVVKAIAGSFKALAAFADFAAAAIGVAEAEESPAIASAVHASAGGGVTRLNLGYTINLHLPATSDIAVFNAIFKSLREHILREP